MKIQILDATKSPEMRKLIKLMIKAANKQKGSRYIKTSFSVIGNPYN